MPDTTYEYEFEVMSQLVDSAKFLMEREEWAEAATALEELRDLADELQGMAKDLTT